MITIERLASPALNLDWHEAAAFAAALAASLRANPAAGIPDRESLGLGPDGGLHLVSGDSDDNPVRFAAGVLADLVRSNPPPAAFADIIQRHLDSRHGATLETFESALAFYERPDRTAVLCALAGRASRLPESAAQNSLTDLAARVRAQEETKRLEPRIPFAVGRRLRRAAAFLIVAAGTVAALLAFGYWMAPGPAPGQPAPPIAQRIQAGLAELVRGSDPPPPPPVAEAPGPEPTRPRRTAPRPRTREAALSDFSVRVGDLGGAIADHVATPAPETPAVPEPDPNVYSSADDDVRPAALIRPHLPSEPPAGIERDQIGVLELTITEQGTVERVRLISPANRFEDRMLVSAAKTWQFRPATKDGRPVRFRTRIRITV
jgi:TonB family protein